MSLLEGEPQRLPELFIAAPIEEWPQPRLVLGVTGAPGSGKSSLTDQLIAEYRQRFPDKRIGVIAVDPSSPFTGGAVLGDRVRMMRHSTDPMIFIRSLASRGHLGGLSLGVKGVLRVMGLIGCDVVFLETVGVGQSEVEVARVADMVMIVLAPGQGDSIQMLKAGLMEIGDLFVINKADKEGANHLHSTLLSALSFDNPTVVQEHHDEVVESLTADPELEDAVLARRRPEKPDVYLVSAVERTGIGDLVTGLEKRAERSRSTWISRRDEAVYDEVREAVFEQVRRNVEEMLTRGGEEQNALGRILSGETTVENFSADLIRRTARAVHAPTEAGPQQ